MSLLLLDEKDLKKPYFNTPTLELKAWSSVARDVICRGFTKDGPFEFRLTATADRVVTTGQHKLPSYPLQVAIGGTNNPIRRGETYVKLTLLMAGKDAMQLCAAYLEDMRSLTAGVFEDCVSGRGLPRSVLGTDPAANTEIDETVPTNVLWLLRGITFVLVTDANAANRRVSIQITDGTNLLMQFYCGTDHTASLTRNYCGTKAPNYAESNFIYVSLPLPILLYQGWHIATSTDNLQATDNFGAPRLDVEEWIQE